MDHDSTAVIVWPAMFPLIDDGHCTILYLGEVEDISAAPEDVYTALPNLSFPGRVAVTGFEVFGSDEKVWVALLDTETLAPLQAEIVEALKEIGVENASEFKDYRPHVTLAPYENDEQDFSHYTFFVLGTPKLWWEGERFPPFPRTVINKLEDRGERVPTQPSEATSRGGRVSELTPEAGVLD